LKFLPKGASLVNAIIMISAHSGKRALCNSVFHIRSLDAIFDLPHPELVEGRLMELQRE
jgi:hypothetical protein